MIIRPSTVNFLVPGGVVLYSRDRIATCAGRLPYRSLAKSRIILGSVKGSVSVLQVLREMLDYVKLEGRSLILLLGPTSPADLPLDEEKVGWVTFVKKAEGEADVTTLSPHDFVEISLFIENCFTENLSSSPVLLGDFLDTVLSASSSFETLYSFYSQLASKIRQHHRTAIFLIKEDLHDARKVEMVKRFADTVFEYRHREENGEVLQEMRVLNLTDGIFGSWMPRIRRHTDDASHENTLDDNAIPAEIAT
jgi:hypothetical protein